jgi:hypothetical protein
MLSRMIASRTLLPLVLPLAGCTTEYETIAQSRVLDSFPTVDCGVLAPGLSNTCIIPLFSQGNAAVTVFDIRVADVAAPDGAVPPPAEGDTAAAEGDAAASSAFFAVRQDWKDPDCDAGTCRQLARYDDSSDEDTLAVPVTFSPTTLGSYQAEVTIWSNDTESTVEQALPDDPERVEAIWKVQLRGMAQPACGVLFPRVIDFGRRVAGGDFSQDVSIQSCGRVLMSVTDYEVTGVGAEAISLYSTFPLYVLPGLSEAVTVGWHVGDTTNGQPTPISSRLSFVSEADGLADASILVVGNHCEESVDSSWDADGDGWTVCGGDCDDTTDAVNPGMPEQLLGAAAGRDEDCDGFVDEPVNPRNVDNDGDGSTEEGGDCHDADATIGPTASETLDQADNDCDGRIDNGTVRWDDDGDGWTEREGDCDDTDPTIEPFAPPPLADGRVVAPGEDTDAGVEVVDDGVDNDCDGIVDEGSERVDDDGDTFTEAGDPSDCDDEDAWTYAGAFEFCDSVDNDCDGAVDEGDDGSDSGACAFQPRRVVAKAPPAQPSGGCTTLPGDAPGTWLGLMVGSALLARRRR